MSKDVVENTDDLPLKEMPDKRELQNQLMNHHNWVESKGEKGSPADLSRIRFPDRINFRKEILSLPPKGATTSWTFQGNLNLTGVNFQHSQLREAEFGKDTVLNGANFSGANLKRTKFTNVELQGADFQNAKLSETEFNEAKLQNAKFQGQMVPRQILKALNFRMPSSNIRSFNPDQWVPN